MPVPRNPAEELALEWAIIEGYLALPNVRLSSGSGGSAPEADVVGFRYGGETLKIIHVETGNLAENQDSNYKIITDKFSRKRTSDIEVIAKDHLEITKENVPTECRKIYITTYVAKKQLPELREQLAGKEIEFYEITEFVLSVVRKSLDSWKKMRKKLGLAKDDKVSIPEEYWLLKFIDWMKDCFRE
ncbi:MAG: hypothetical protein ACFFD4_36975 [Candidatus Odinarchaeota archaeon]